ncbi:Putative mur-like, catalytic domain superfamily protein [Septoria linicola]|uniref:Mur-like, catalytic domain superfamily protein n=1 Tax=Septoria linicola TaxID=215465 RepID=A0A9Q9AXM6_9PEZI|nr:putative mur-like, catalytic domain superfamily protein [Septoria linicola]USW54370.1 Putative mur-like, catalytic domain superfamily protein [Septoria linicola]
MGAGQDIRGRLERIRINFEPLSEKKFAKYVSDVYEKLELPKLGRNGPKYLQFLFLVSVHAFIQEDVEPSL